MGPVALIEKEENKDERWFDTLTTLRKFNPVAFALVFALMYFFTQVLHSNTPLPEKLSFLFLSGTIYVIALFFEFYRIGKEREQKEKLWS